MNSVVISGKKLLQSRHATAGIGQLIYLILIIMGIWVSVPSVENAQKDNFLIP